MLLLYIICFLIEYNFSIKLYSIKKQIEIFSSLINL